MADNNIRRMGHEFTRLLRRLQLALALTTLVPLIALSYLIIRYVMPSSIIEYGIMGILLAVMVLMLIGTRTIFNIIVGEAAAAPGAKTVAARGATRPGGELRLEGRSIRHKMAEATALVGIIPILSLGYIIVRYVLPINTSESIFALTALVVALLILGITQIHKLTGRMIRVAESVNRLSTESGGGVSAPGTDEIGVMSKNIRSIADTISRRTEALESTKIFMSNLIERLPHPLLVVGPSDEITLANPAAATLLGYDRSELVGKSVADLFSGEEDAKTLLHESMADAREATWQTKDETNIPIALCAAPLYSGASDGGMVVVGTNLARRKKLEEELRHAVKMEAIGRLAGGIAHDFNNILTIIRGHLYFLKRSFDRGEGKKEALDSFYKTVDRASSLVYQLLAFSRKQVLTPRVISLNTVISGMQAMLQRLLGEDIRVVTDLAADLGNTRADRGQMEQIIVNLAINARDAMPGGGTLTVRTANIDCGPDDAGICRGAERGPYVGVFVSDTGCGIGPEIREKIFEPFFTTKKVGKGSGLGLSTVYGIVAQHGGRISLVSEAGKGSEFTILMPRVRVEAVPPKPPSREARPPKGSETILFVEDDSEILDLASEALNSQGYTVLTARNGREAIGVAARHGGDIDILVTDVVMPLVGGKELADRMRKSRPDIKIIYVSGYTDGSIITQDILEGGHSFIQKPYTIESLLTHVRKVLDGVPVERSNS